MSTINAVMNIGVSGISSAQSQLSVISDNISNINTPGYIRKILNQTSVVQSGVGVGVRTDQIQLAGDSFLQQASLRARASSGQLTAQNEMFDNIQAQFGDPSTDNSVFNQANSVFSSLSALAETPSSNALRQSALANLSSFLSETGRISTQIQQVRTDADTRIAADVQSINDLLKTISDLNSSVASAVASGSDSSGAENAQAQALDALSKLIDVTANRGTTGALQVRTTGGTPLIGSSASKLSYTPAGTVNTTTGFNPILSIGDNAGVRDLTDGINSGELKGLLDIRDRDSVAVSQQLSDSVSTFTNTLNALHNQGASVPAPQSLSGKNTSQTLTEGLNGFSGQSRVYVTDASGVVQKQVLIDFTTHQYYVDGSASANSFTNASFVGDINSALGGAATISFSNGTLGLSAASSNNGVAVVDDKTTPASKNGQGFGQFFGLNDLITAPVPINYATGLSAASNHGFTTGDQIQFSVSAGNSTHLANISFAIPAATDMASLITALNSPTSGLGQFGNFALDSQGRLSFTGSGTPAATFAITSDGTSRLGNGASFSQFFGLGGVASDRAAQVSVNANLSGNPARIAMATIDQTKATGTQALFSGDGTAIQALSQASLLNTTFQKAGTSNGGVSTLSHYSADLAGQLGNRAQSLQNQQDSASKLLNITTTRRQATEGVNLDQELVQMTTYQQAYNASGRIIQAAKDMYDVLLNMVQ